MRLRLKECEKELAWDTKLGRYFEDYGSRRRSRVP